MLIIVIVLTLASDPCVDSGGGDDTTLQYSPIIKILFFILPKRGWLGFGR